MGYFQSGIECLGQTMFIFIIMIRPSLGAVPSLTKVEKKKI